MPAPLEALRPRLSDQARVATDEAVRTIYSRDCWPMLQLDTQEGRADRFVPDAVVHVRSEADVVACVRWAAEHGVPLVPFGAGSGVAGAAVAHRGGVILDVKGLLDIDLSRAHTDGIARVGAGWLGRVLEHEFNRHGLTLGHFPSSIGCSTMGGYAATRSAGQLSTRYGKFEDMVLDIRYVDGRGEIRHSADALERTQWIVGSEGALGVLLDVAVHVEPLGNCRRFRGFQAASVAAGLGAIRTMMQAGHRPAVVRLYDEFDTWLAARPRKSHTTRVRKPGGARLLRLANQLYARTIGSPLLLNRLSDAVFEGCMLIVCVEEPDDAMADAAAEDCFSLLRASGLVDLGEGPGRHWYENRYAVSYKQAPMLDAGFFVDTMEVAATWDRIEALYREVRTAIGRHAFVMAHFSHAYDTGCSIYFTFAGFAKDAEERRSGYLASWRAGLDAASRAGGAVTHHHGVGLLKAGRMYQDHRNGDRPWRAIKQELDPAGVLNPGKLWDAEVDFP